MRFPALMAITLGLAFLIGCGAGNKETKPAGAPAVAQPPQNGSKGKVDDSLLAKLQGEWQAETMVTNGKTTISQGKNTNPNGAAVANTVFQGPVMYSKNNNKLSDPQKIVYLAAEGGLIHMDTVGDLGDGKEATVKWLAKADGEIFTICMAFNQKDNRPVVLESKPGSNIILSGYKRKKN